jgi:hypothetical protein
VLRFASNNDFHGVDDRRDKDESASIKDASTAK